MRRALLWLSYWRLIAWRRWIEFRYPGTRPWDFDEVQRP